MRRKLYGNDIRPKCSYCRFGTLSEDRGAILCRAKGIVAAGYHCRRFRYDPLKRIPQTAYPMPEYTEEMFAIE